MSGRILVVLIVAAMLNACGVKNDLEIPNEQPPMDNERDPSRPPQPLGQ